MTVFVDTSGLYAILDSGDANHSVAKALWDLLLSPQIILETSNYVLVEATALIQRRLGMEAVSRLYADLLPSLDLTWVDHEVQAIAIGLLLGQNRRSLSLVDCTSFELMRRQGLTHVYAFDRHFPQQGFRLFEG